MSHLNETALHGVLTRPPELRALETGEVVAGFTVGLTLGTAERAYPVYQWCEAYGDPTDVLSRLDTGHEVMVSGPVQLTSTRLALVVQRLQMLGAAPQGRIVEHEGNGGQRLNGGMAASLVQGEVMAEPVQHDVGLELRIKCVDQMMLPDGRVQDVPRYVPLLLRGDLAASPPALEVGDTVLASGLPFRAASLSRSFILARTLSAPTPETP